jgi:hypothetical protein
MNREHLTPFETRSGLWTRSIALPLGLVALVCTALDWRFHVEDGKENRVQSPDLQILIAVSIDLKQRPLQCWLILWQFSSACRYA